MLFCFIAILLLVWLFFTAKIKMSGKIFSEIVVITIIVLCISATVKCTTPSSQLKVIGHESVKMYSSPASFSGKIQSERQADYGYIYLPTVNRY